MLIYEKCIKHCFRKVARIRASEVFRHNSCGYNGRRGGMVVSLKCRLLAVCSTCRDYEEWRFNVKGNGMWNGRGTPSSPLGHRHTAVLCSPGINTRLREKNRLPADYLKCRGNNKIWRADRLRLDRNVKIRQYTQFNVFLGKIKIARPRQKNVSFRSRAKRVSGSSKFCD